MPRPTYCTPVDALRRFNPQIDEAQLESNDFIGNEDVEQIVSRIEGVEDDFDRRARPFREVRVGHGPNSYVYRSAKGRGFPIHIWVDHVDLIPIDASAGDVIERRTGIDNWTDITAEQGSAWAADYRKGKFTFYEVPGRGHLPVINRRHKERFIRMSYRHGAPGGDRRKAGQTTISAELSSGDSPSGHSVADASRLPPSGGTMLVDGVEYVRVDAVDVDNDTIDVGERGLRGTDETTVHDSGSTIHYCPMDVREAVAAKVAREAVLYDDWTAQLIDTGTGPQPAPKLEEWQAEFAETVGRYSMNYGYA